MTPSVAESLKYYQAIFNATSEAIIVLDARSGRIVDINDRMLEIYGYRRDEALAADIGQLSTGTAPYSQADALEKIGKARSGGPQTFAWHARKKNGELFWCEVSITSVEFSDFDRIIAVVRDITERRRAEDELRTTKDRLEATLSALPDLMFRTDREGCIHECHYADMDKLYVSPDVFMGKKFSDVLPAEASLIIKAALDEAAAQGSHHGAIYSLQMPQGVSWFELSIAAMGAVATPDTHFIVLVRDITERKRFESELEQARDGADAANRAKSEFLANMSHEIRTPMSGIMGMVELLEYTELTDRQAQYLDVIRTSAESLLSLINDVLDLAKIDSGKIELERRDFSLRGSISDVIKTQISLIRRKGLSIQTDIPADVPDNLTGDQLRMKQILLNLLGNAIKFTEKGGISITVTVSERREYRALLRIGVTDSGIGISPEAMEQIFAPFVQADASTTRQYGGTGLGLSICTRLAALMGGRIWAESREGVGSTFFLQLPCAVNDAVAAPHNRRSSDRVPHRWDGPSLRILLVDDQEANLLIAGEILQQAGHTVFCAGDGREALEKWEVEAFDVILMDVQMPVMGGVEATRAIREKERSRGGHMPIIAVTARALREEREHIQSQGFDGYVTKPFRIGELLGEMKRCLTAA